MGHMCFGEVARIFLTGGTRPWVSPRDSNSNGAIPDTASWLTARLEACDLHDVYWKQTSGSTVRRFWIQVLAIAQSGVRGVLLPGADPSKSFLSLVHQVGWGSVYMQATQKLHQTVLHVRLKRVSCWLATTATIHTSKTVLQSGSLYRQHTV